MQPRVAAALQPGPQPVVGPAQADDRRAGAQRRVGGVLEAPDAPAAAGDEDDPGVGVELERLPRRRARRRVLERGTDHAARVHDRVPRAGDLRHLGVDSAWIIACASMPAFAQKCSAARSVISATTGTSR